jgi:hypothetical protein
LLSPIVKGEQKHILYTRNEKEIRDAILLGGSWTTPVEAKVKSLSEVSRDVDAVSILHPEAILKIYNVGTPVAKGCLTIVKLPGLVYFVSAHAPGGPLAWGHPKCGRLRGILAQIQAAAQAQSQKDQLRPRYLDSVEMPTSFSLNRSLLPKDGF